MRLFFAGVAVTGAIALSAACVRAPSNPIAVRSVATTATPNDNRVAAGSFRSGVLRVDLDAVWTSWRPDLDVDSSVTVQAFAERGQAPLIPGPLVRVPMGTEVRVTVRNLIPDSTLIVHGLRGGAVADDTFSVAPGATREIGFIAGKPGTFLYWGTTSHTPIRDRTGRDSQLSGAIVVDAIGVRPDPKERIFVISLIDIRSKREDPPPHEEVWEIAINGLSWPHTERVSYAVGDTVRWRWINATDRSHPMHLHGFHFRVTSKGNGSADTLYAPDKTRLAVTELADRGSTFALEWIPRRAGNWLVHCHMTPHIVPHPSRADSLRGHDSHDPSRHPYVAMAGLVMGVTTTGDDVAPASTEPAKTNLRLLVQQRDTGRRVRKGFVLQRGLEPPPDSVHVPGSPLVVTRGEKTAVTVVNRLTEATSVHWHGMELESVFDGVAGYSGIGNARAPLIPPGDSFTVSFTPPRAGTYMYHTHMDEGDQLFAGLYGPLIVLEPGEQYDPSTDLTFIVGFGPDTSRLARGRAINGALRPTPRTLKAGVTYRLRLINLMFASPENLDLFAADSSLSAWRLISKDGAAVTGSAVQPAHVRIGVGEAYDFEWTPKAGEAFLTARIGTTTSGFAGPVVQKFIVTP